MSFCNLGNLLSNLSVLFGEIINHKILDTDWVERTRQSPLWFTTPFGKFVYHPLDKTSNLKHYLSKLNKKNDPVIISSPIVAILDEGFVTSFVEGEILTTLSVKDIPSIAQLQATFHQVEDYNLYLWYKKLDMVSLYLLQHNLIAQKEIPKIQFSRYGLIHGDYSLKNIVKTIYGLVTIDLEHVVEGPIAFDLARPLLRICSNKLEQQIYLYNYFQGRSQLSQEELDIGRATFYLIQIYDRHRFGYPAEAGISLEQFRKVFK